jgi:hypothetical protein
MPRPRWLVYLIVALGVVSLGAATSVSLQDGGHSRQQLTADAVCQALRDHGCVRITDEGWDCRIWARRVEGRRALEVVWKDYDVNGTCTRVVQAREVVFQDGGLRMRDVWFGNPADGQGASFNERFVEWPVPATATLEIP